MGKKEEHVSDSNEPKDGQKVTTLQPTVKLAAWLEAMPEREEDLPAQINYLMTKEGVVVFRRLPFGVITEKLEGEPLLASPHPLLPPLPPLKVWLTTPKIPWAIYTQIVAFFRAVNEKHKAEAIIRVFWDPDTDQWIPHCPEQEVGAAKVDHKDDFDKEGHYRHVADIHSHNTMSAFFSGTDDADEKKAVRLYGVIGKIQHPIPASSWRAWTGKAFAPLKFADVITLPTEEEVEVAVKFPVKSMVQESDGVETFTLKGESVAAKLFSNDFPKEWMDKVNTQSFYTYHKTGKATGGGSRGKWEWDEQRRRWVEPGGEPADPDIGHDVRGHHGPAGFLPYTGYYGGRDWRDFGKGDHGGDHGHGGKSESADERRARGGAEHSDGPKTPISVTKYSVPWTELGSVDLMAAAAFWAALNVNHLVYLVDVGGNNVYRVYPDQKVELRHLKIGDLAQMVARKMLVSQTPTKLFGVGGIFDLKVIDAVRETFRGLDHSEAVKEGEVVEEEEDHGDSRK